MLKFLRAALGLEKKRAPSTKLGDAEHQDHPTPDHVKPWQPGPGAPKHDAHRVAAKDRFVALSKPPVDPTIAKMTAPETLRALYGPAWPEMRLEVEALDGSGAKHRAQWFDGDKMIGYSNMSLSRAQDGALQLFGGGTRVDPAYRGQGGPNRMMPRLVAWLREGSAHPNTAITIGAGAAGGEKMGPYVWANFGFDFANIHADRIEIKEHTSARALYGMEPEPQVFRRAFASWLDAQRKSGQLPDDDELIGHLKDASAHWQHPWEITSFDVPGVRVDLAHGERIVKAPLGKAFMLDPKTPTWTGVFFVNDPDSPGAKIQNRYTRRGVGHGNEDAP